MKNRGRTSAEAMARYEVRNMGDGKGRKCTGIMIVGAKRIEGEWREVGKLFGVSWKGRRSGNFGRHGNRRTGGMVQAGVGELPSTSQGVRLTCSAVRVPDGERHCASRSRTDEKRWVEGHNHNS